MDNVSTIWRTRRGETEQGGRETSYWGEERTRDKRAKDEEGERGKTLRRGERRIQDGAIDKERGLRKEDEILGREKNKR